MRVRHPTEQRSIDSATGSCPHARPPDGDQLRHLFAEADDPLALFEPVVDRSDNVVDVRLTSWNGAFLEHPDLGQAVRDMAGDARRSSSVDRSRIASQRHRIVARVAAAVDQGRSVEFVGGPQHQGKRRESVVWSRQNDQVLCHVTRFEPVAVDHVLADERERIARNLHDSVVQRLYAAALEVDLLSTSGRVDGECATLRPVGETLHQLIAELRDQIFDIKNAMCRGVREDLLSVVAPIVRSTAVEVDIRSDLDGIDDPEVADHVRAVVHEATSNGVRHGRASHIDIVVTRRDGRLMVEVDDNGIGLAKSSVTNGLRNLQRRAELMSGMFAIGTRTGGGTSLRWSVPLVDSVNSDHIRKEICRNV